MTRGERVDSVASKSRRRRRITRRKSWTNIWGRAVNVKKVLRVQWTDGQSLIEFIKRRKRRKKSRSRRTKLKRKSRNDQVVN